MPATRRLELGTECLTMVADERSIVCGLGDGRVDVYHRASLTRYRCSIHFLDSLIYLQAVQDKNPSPAYLQETFKVLQCVCTVILFSELKFFQKHTIFLNTLYKDLGTSL